MASPSAVQVATPGTLLETSDRTAMVVDALLDVLDEPVFGSQVALLESPIPFSDPLQEVGIFRFRPLG